VTTTYPFTIDNNTSLPPAPSSIDGYIYINGNLGAIEAIETELGPLPSSSYPDVRTRLDVLESRINNPCVPTGGDYISIGGTSVTITAGTGDPNVNHVSAYPGSVYLREDGTNDQTMYGMNTDGYWYVVGAAAGSKTGVTNVSSSPYNVVPTDNILAVNASSGPITVNLPASPSAGDEYVIKDANGISATNHITVNGSSINVDGSSSYVIMSAYEALTVAYNGTEWSVL
jgi:hypothetical protein